MIKYENMVFNIMFYNSLFFILFSVDVVVGCMNGVLIIDNEVI